MSIVNRLDALRQRIKYALQPTAPKTAPAEPAAQSVAPQGPPSAPRSVLPSPLGAPTRANFGTLKRKPFGRGPIRR